MITSNLKNALTVIFVFIALSIFLGFPTDAEATWHSQADDMPGISSTTMLLVVGGGALIIGAILISKSHNKHKEGEKEDESSSMLNPSFQWSCSNSISNYKPYSSLKSLPRVLPYISLAPSPSATSIGTYNLKSTALIAGITVNL